MIIYNKTNQVQELKVHDRQTGRHYSVYVCANGSTEVDNDLSIPTLMPLMKKGILQVSGTIVVNPVASPAEETIPEESDSPAEETIPGESDSPVSEETTPLVDESAPDEEPTEESSTFVCEICGKECASSRGLMNHMNKSHKE